MTCARHAGRVKRPISNRLAALGYLNLILAEAAMALNSVSVVSITRSSSSSGGMTLIELYRRCPREHRRSDQQKQHPG